MASLKNNGDIVIKPADKGIINRMDHIQEGLRLLNNTDQYEFLMETPPQPSMNNYYRYYSKV